MKMASGVVERAYQCLDLFGASQRVQKTWERSGYKGLAYDIKLCKDHDLVSELGFKTLLYMGLQLLESRLE